MAGKKVVKKLPIVKKPSKAKSVSKSFNIEKPFSKAEVISFMTEMAGIVKKQTIAIMDALSHIVDAHLSKKGPGAFMFPGVAKFRVVKKPATKARKGKNPFTGKEMTFAAKPACNTVKAKPLKKLKDLVK